MLFIDYSESVSSEHIICTNTNTNTNTTNTTNISTNTTNTTNSTNTNPNTHTHINTTRYIEEKLPQVPRIIPVNTYNTDTNNNIKRIRKRDKCAHSCLLCCVSCVLCCGGAEDYITEAD